MYIDLFAGCGGLSLGLHKAGVEGLFAVEKNPDAFSTLRYNLIQQNGHFNWPDWLEVAHIDINDIIDEKRNHLIALRGQIDLVVGGPPCQGFSMAGQRKKNDIRNKLMNSYIEFIQLVQPEMIFFENVHGFTVGFKNKKDSKKKGLPYSEKLVKSLKKEGYNVSTKMIIMSDYGVPQKRSRFILFGIKDGNPDNFFTELENRRQEFLDTKGYSMPVTVLDAIGDLVRSNGTVPSPDSKGFLNGVYGGAISNYQHLMRQDVTDDNIPDSHRFARQSDKTKKILKELMKVSDIAIRVTPKQNLVEGLKKRGVTPLKEQSICPTITSIPDDFVHYSEARIMTVREHARIQSFPDDFEFKGKYTTGGKLRKVDVPRYTQVANAVPPIFAEQVGCVINEVEQWKNKKN